MWTRMPFLWSLGYMLVHSAIVIRMIPWTLSYDPRDILHWQSSLPLVYRWELLEITWPLGRMALEFRFLNSVDPTCFATHIYFGGSSYCSPDTLSLHEIMAVPIHDPLVGPILINQHGRVRLTPSMIPDAFNFDAKDSSFFNKWSELPDRKSVV